MKPLVDANFLLEKYPGKGGWTYARIPQIKQDKNNSFGWVRVKGSIDDVEIKKYHLMPMGDGRLFLPVKAEIRKKIQKREGDTVHIILYPDNDPMEVPDELRACLEEEPRAIKFFNSLSESEQRHYVQWVYSAKKEETMVNRLAQTIDRLLKGQKLHQKV